MNSVNRKAENRNKEREGTLRVEIKREETPRVWIKKTGLQCVEIKRERMHRVGIQKIEIERMIRYRKEQGFKE